MANKHIGNVIECVEYLRLVSTFVYAYEMAKHIFSSPDPRASRSRSVLRKLFNLSSREPRYQFFKTKLVTGIPKGTIIKKLWNLGMMFKWCSSHKWLIFKSQNWNETFQYTMKIQLCSNYDLRGHGEATIGLQSWQRNR